MFYAKNVPAWERTLRIAMGLIALAFAAFSWGSPLAVVVGLAGATLSMTGLAGFCPMCALVGRKLDKGA
jgi:fatty acid desaturase